MITFLLDALGVLVPGAGVAVGVLGFAIKALKLVGIGGGLIANPLSALAERFADLIEWTVKGVLGYLGSKVAAGIDHISSSVPATLLVLAIAWGAFLWGQWSHAAPSVPPMVKSAPPASKPKSPPPTKPAERTVLDEIDCFFKGGC